MFKLLIKNKITEIVNFIYGFWTEDETFQPMGKYIAIVLVTVIPMTYVYSFLIPFTDNPPLFLKIIVWSALYMFTCFFICMVHVGVVNLYKWIKKNIELAKNGVEVKANWKK